MRPLIGVIPLVDPARESYWMLPGYLHGIERAGGLPLVLPLTGGEEELGQLAAVCDGFLFTGGHDVDPARYGEEPLGIPLELCPERDAMEFRLLELLLPTDKPILGICRGLQLLNAALGGSLYQDLPAQRGNAIEHRQKPPYSRPSHEVRVVPDTPLRALTGADAILVNSCHHQGVKTLAPPLSVMAIAGDGLIEAVYLPDKRFVWAVQWHPEFMPVGDEISARLFRAFVESCTRVPSERRK